VILEAKNRRHLLLERRPDRFGDDRRRWGAGAAGRSRKPQAASEQPHDET
jgi:hypothetical protein